MSDGQGQGVVRCVQLVDAICDERADVGRRQERKIGPRISQGDKIARGQCDPARHQRLVLRDRERQNVVCSVNSVHMIDAQIGHLIGGKGREVRPGVDDVMKTTVQRNALEIVRNGEVRHCSPFSPLKY